MENTPLSNMAKPAPPGQPSANNTRWKSTCCDCDKEVALYGSKLVISLIILAFAMYQIIVNDDDCKDMSFPTSLIAAILGSFTEQAYQKLYTPK